MQEDKTTEITVRRSWWKIGGSGEANGSTWLVRGVILLVAIAVVVGVFYGMYKPSATAQPGEVLLGFPEDWVVKWELIKWVNDGLDWVVIKGDVFFSGIRDGVQQYILSPLRDFLTMQPAKSIGAIHFGFDWVRSCWIIVVLLAGFLMWYTYRRWWVGLLTLVALGALYYWIPWLVVVALVGLVAWRVVSLKLSIVVVIFLVAMNFFGMTDLAMETLAVTFTASLLCIVMGVPLGIIAATSNRFDNFLRPILDGMQTMPSFVYLVPALMLFGLGMVPAVMATLIYAIPPIIRLTNLGIRQVDAQVVEASKSFGSTAMQLLTKVQVPLALPTILAGLNQTVMMALAMVVVASMIGAKGLGVEVLTGIGRINPGQGLIGGISIVFLAIILDRISQGFARQPQPSVAT